MVAINDIINRSVFRNRQIGRPTNAAMDLISETVDLGDKPPNLGLLPTTENAISKEALAAPEQQAAAPSPPTVMDRAREFGGSILGESYSPALRKFLSTDSLSGIANAVSQRPMSIVETISAALGGAADSFAAGEERRRQARYDEAEQERLDRELEIQQGRLGVQQGELSLAQQKLDYERNKPQEVKNPVLGKIYESATQGSFQRFSQGGATGFQNLNTGEIVDNLPEDAQLVKQSGTNVNINNAELPKDLLESRKQAITKFNELVDTDRNAKAQYEAAVNVEAALDNDSLNTGLLAGAKNLLDELSVLVAEGQEFTVESLRASGRYDTEVGQLMFVLLGKFKGQISNRELQTAIKLAGADRSSSIPKLRETARTYQDLALREGSRLKPQIENEITAMGEDVASENRQKYDAEFWNTANQDTESRRGGGTETQETNDVEYYEREDGTVGIKGVN